MCDGWGRNRVTRVGKNSGPILSRLWAKIREILGHYRGPIVLSNVLSRLSIRHVSFRRYNRYSPLSLKVVEHLKKCTSFWPPIFLRDHTKLCRPAYSRLLSRFTIHCLAKFDEFRLLISVCEAHDGQLTKIFQLS